MPTSDSPCVLHDLKITEDTIRVWLEDGRTFTVPLGWYPRLRQAKDKAQAHWRPESQGTDVHWPHLQERLLLETLLFEVPTENPNSGGCPVLTDLKITEDTIRVWLEDGRTFTVPLKLVPAAVPRNGRGTSQLGTSRPRDGCSLARPGRGCFHRGVDDRTERRGAKTLGRWLLARQQRRGVRDYEIVDWERSHRAAPLK